MYLRRNRSSLRMEDWLTVCTAVNAHRGDLNRTLAQCRTRICTLKARYKEEVAKGRPTSGSCHFAQLRAFLTDPNGPPPGFNAKTPAASVKKEKEEDEEEEDEEDEEASGCVGGSAGGREVPVKRHFSSLRDILERSGDPSPATVKEEETVKKEEVVGCGCELVGGPGAVVMKLAAEMTKLAEVTKLAPEIMKLAVVYERVEMERLKLKEEMLKVKKEEMEMDDVKLQHKKLKAENPEEADDN